MAQALRDAKARQSRRQACPIVLALAAGHPDTAIAVLGDLPADAFSPREVAALEVQLAALQDDSRTESAALERLVRLDPGDAAAWERLAELAAAMERSIGWPRSGVEKQRSIETAINTAS